MTHAEVAAEPNKLYTVSEVAMIFRRTDLTIQRWLRAGQFDGAKKIGNEWLITGHAILAKLGKELTVIMPERMPSKADARRRGEAVLNRIGSRLKVEHTAVLS